jgi:hypothetical protein
MHVYFMLVVCFLGKKGKFVIPHEFKNGNYDCST